ncbi:MAG: HigA family addiction module antitoxin [Muribaculaceae bacterium]
METRNERLAPFRAVHPGEILREELKERGITQKAFASMIGVQASHLSEFIRGRRNMNEDWAMRFEKALSIPFQTWMSLHAGFVYDTKAVAAREEMAATASGQCSEEACRIGEALKAARCERHLSQDELAEIMGVGSYQVRRIERGYNLTVNNVISAFKALGIAVSLNCGNRSIALA